jgi:hypothetical protein
VVVVEAGTSAEKRRPISLDAAPRIAEAISTVFADRAGYRSAALHVAEDISSSPLPADLPNRFVHQTRDPASSHETLSVRADTTRRASPGG